MANARALPRPNRNFRRFISAATDATACAETRPTNIVSTVPMAMSPTSTAMTGTARRHTRRSVSS